MENSVLARNILLLGALDDISAVATERKLEFLMLKGAALLMEGIWAPGERDMTDLDLLIKPGSENAFDTLLADLGFKPMENSSQAYYRMPSRSAPPIIVDVHTALWHERETGALWHRSRFLTGSRSSGAAGPVRGLGFEDQLLHVASHPLLHHGLLTRRNLEDIARLLDFIYGKTTAAPFG